jgi:hypothetical protein
MDSGPILAGLEKVTRKWTKQRKSEERQARRRSDRQTMWAFQRLPLKEICYAHMQLAWDRTSDQSRLPTYWRQVYYVMREICDRDPDCDRPLKDSTFKGILEDYLVDYEPGWDVLRGARGVFKEPHARRDDNGLAMSTLNVRLYLERGPADSRIGPIPMRFPTAGAENRIAAVLICEKEGFDELLIAAHVPQRYDLALMSTKGISALAARDLAAGIGVPCFTLHDLDKNGFVMAAGFPFATDIGLRLTDVDDWGLTPERQHHLNPSKTRDNLLRNGATEAEAEFISAGQRVELNMLTGRQFIDFVEQKLDQHGVKKLIPDDNVLGIAWRRAHAILRVNELIRTLTDFTQSDQSPDSHRHDPVPPVPDDLAERIRAELQRDPTRCWDDVVGVLAAAQEAE